MDKKYYCNDCRKETTLGKVSLADGYPQYGCSYCESRNISSLSVFDEPKLEIAHDDRLKLILLCAFDCRPSELETTVPNLDIIMDALRKSYQLGAIQAGSLTSK